MEHNWVVSLRRVFFFNFCAFLLGFRAVLAAEPAAATPFITPLTSSSLDSAAFAQWVDGAESPLTAKEGPRRVMWTRDSTPEWDGIKFGESKNAGPRHLRIGWKTAVPVGSVLARAGGQLSVLKTTAAYPGRLDVEDDWTPAERIANGQPSRDEVMEEQYAVWVLTPGTVTRALRFTHTSSGTEKTYGGWLGGAFAVSQRFVNVAPTASVTTSSGSANASKVNNELNDNTWGTWDNAPEENAQPVSAAHPVFVTLVWPQATKLRGVNALWPGFAAADVQAFNGGATDDPLDAPESVWETVKSTRSIQHQYPRALSVNWIDLGREVNTRALRLRITAPVDERGIHEHLRNKTRAGRRVWVGELMALQPLGSGDMKTALVQAGNDSQVHPPIPIQFTLPQESIVTLAIEDAQGRRIRNLIAETKFPAGSNTVWWDGTDDLLRNAEAAKHGLYDIPARFVNPGSYTVRGIYRQPIDLRYEFSIYNAGHPAWETADKTGAWLANHTPPCAALFVPAARSPSGKEMVYLGSFVSEGGHGLAWVDLNGRKVGGVGWVGGTWTGAGFLARDDGADASVEVAAYVASPWSVETYVDKAKDKRGEVRLTAITRKGMKPVLKHVFTPSFAGKKKTGEDDFFGEVGGLAAHNGVVAFSLTKLDQLVFVDTHHGNAVREVPMKHPRGIAYDRQGRLLVISESQVVVAEHGAKVITSGLEDPRQLTVDPAGNIYVSDHGASHQVKVFSAAGKLVRTIGKPGAPKSGPYDPEHMNHPLGLTLDGQGRLWVAEHDFQPKRVSVWSTDGKFVRAFYGPSEYGGGGKLDPEDKSRFYYHGMEFRLDWDKGTDQLVRVFHRPGPEDETMAAGWGSTGAPEQPHYVSGECYFSNDHNSNPTGGSAVTTLWRDADGIARPVAAIGNPHDWKLLKEPRFAKRWPSDLDANGEQHRNPALFVWCDLNGDAHVQPEEITIRKAKIGSFTVAPDLSFVGSRVDNEAVRFAPVRFTAQHVPVYDIARGDVLARDVQGPTSSGGDQALWHESGWTVLTTPPKPFSPLSVGAVYQREPRWSYPSLWPGLHASHESPAPDRAGEIIGTTRLLGDFIQPRGSDAGPIWGINGNQGNMYLFTADGFFVAELFHDVRRAPTWSMPAATRNMPLNGLTLHDENFWPTMTQTKDGNVYLCDGARSSLVRVDGLDSIRRLPNQTINITAAELTAARVYFDERETRRQSSRGRALLKVALRDDAPRVDGKLDDWSGAEWAEIDKSGVAAFFDSKSKPFDVRAALAISGDRLYAAYRTGDAELLRNSGEDRHALFKTGGALDLMLGANPSADDKRAQPAPGDLRLLITRVRGKTAATLYRAVVPGTRQPVPFSSPWRTITLDKVEDVSDAVELAGADGNYEFSIPLKVLGLQPAPGGRLKGDIGILRGNGFQTVQRVYWSNKATGITSDVPSEAELTPKLWGKWEIVTSQRAEASRP